MLLILIDNNTLIKKEFETSFDYKGICIQDNRICLKKDYYFADDEKIKKLENRQYQIKNSKNYYYITLLIYDSKDKYSEFKMYEKTDIVLSKDHRSNIVLKDDVIDNYYLSIQNDKIKSNGIVFLNGKTYHDESIQELDFIEFYGICIYCFKDFYYTNSFNIEIKLKQYKPILRKIEYRVKTNSKQVKLKEPKKELVIEKIKQYEKPNKNIAMTNISSSVVMVLTSLMMASISFYNSLLNHQPIFLRISFLIMPIGMFITSILIPLLKRKKEIKQYQNEVSASIEYYIDYLKQYDEKLKQDIKEYIDRLNEDYFSIMNKDQLFSLDYNQEQSLTISIGKTTIHKEIEIPYTNNDKIDSYLNTISNRLSCIENYPIFIDLKKYHNVDVIVSSADRNYFLNKYILELSAKHDFNQINIGVYSKEETTFDPIYNLPFLFIENRRQTYLERKDLIEIDQTKLDKPLVVILYDEVDYTFHNPNIIAIYFHDSLSKIKQIKGPIIEYHNQNGYVYIDKKIYFQFYYELFDYKSYYEYFGKLKVWNKKDAIISFKDVFLIHQIEYDYLHPDGLLQAKFAYLNNEVFSLDLHESKQGPHGLIGGSTGSGKSELIVSLILSLCIRYSPLYLNIVLIDYKGGGIENSLSYKGIVIPHIIASVSNLEENSLERVIIALKNECLKRQKKFKELSNTLKKSISNLDEYRLYKKKEDIASLLIVVDEFAELKAKHHELIDELISISRIGRSLGIHLILATQKPSGTINEEIWSNAKFKIALKVNEEKDSNDIIKTKDAAYIHKPGQFYLRVNDSLLKADSFYLKQDIDNKDDYCVKLFNTSLDLLKDYIKKQKEIMPINEYYCKNILQLCKKHQYKIDKLDYRPPMSVSRMTISKPQCFTFGISDDYLRDQHKIVSYSIYESILIHSNRKNEINNIINTLLQNEKDVVVLSNDCFKNVQSIRYDQEEEIFYLFKTILKRELTIIIHDVELFLSYSEENLMILIKLLKQIASMNSNIVCLTQNSNLNYRLIQSFKHKLLIETKQINSQIDFFNVKSDYKGNSYYCNETLIPFTPCLIEELLNKDKKIIVENFDDLKHEIKDDKFLIGYTIDDRKKLYVDKNTWIIGIQEKTLKFFKEYYKEAKVIKYDYSISSNTIQDFVWVGQGIYNQSLIVSGLKNDLKSNEGLYVSNNEIKKVKIIDE